MRLKVTFILIFALVLKLNAQVYPDVNARLFTIVQKGDTVNFLKVDTCLTKKKPTIIFLQGSRQIPLIIDYVDFRFIPSISNFDYQKLSTKYNIIVISKPYIPIVVSKDNLDSQFNCKSEKIDADVASKYFQNDMLDNYVTRTNAVVNYLAKQKWVDASQILVVGHSEGANIAIKLAKNKYVKAVGYLSGNPDGGFSKYLKETRVERYSLKRTAAAVQDSINLLYDDWKQKCSYNSQSPKNTKYYIAKAWLSFAGSLRDEIIAIKKPIFIAYGTEDIGRAIANDLLPIYFMHKGKTNYKMMPMVGCGHNFEELSPEGVSNFDKMYWDDVMNGFVRWFEDLKE